MSEEEIQNVIACGMFLVNKNPEGLDEDIKHLWRLSFSEIEVHLLQQKSENQLEAYRLLKVIHITEFAPKNGLIGKNTETINAIVYIENYFSESLWRHLQRHRNVDKRVIGVVTRRVDTMFETNIRPTLFYSGARNFQYLRRAMQRNLLL